MAQRFDVIADDARDHDQAPRNLVIAWPRGESFGVAANCVQLA